MNVMQFLGLKVAEADTAGGDVSTVSAELAAATYFKSLALATAISYKANALALATVRTYERGREVKGDLWYLLNFSPNPNMSAAQFWTAVVDSLCRRGEALVVPISNRLYVAQSFHEDVRQLGENVFDSIQVEEKSYPGTFRASECVHFKLGDRNISAYVSSMLDSYSELMAAAMKSYRETAGQKYRLVLDRAATGTRSEADDVDKMLKANVETFVRNANSIYIETRGQRLEPVKVEGATEPSDITDLRKEIYDSAAIAFKIPRSVLYGDMTNMADLVDTMLTFSVDPEAEMISDELTRKCYTRAEVCAGSKVKLDTTTVKHIDIFDSAPAIMNLVSSGAFTIDDVLTALGREPVGDEITTKRLMTKNLGAVEDVLRQMQQGGD